jgi:hypothetical protein
MQALDQRAVVTQAVMPNELVGLLNGSESVFDLMRTEALQLLVLQIDQYDTVDFGSRFDEAVRFCVAKKSYNAASSSSLCGSNSMSVSLATSYRPVFTFHLSKSASPVSPVMRHFRERRRAKAFFISSC